MLDEFQAYAACRIGLESYKLPRYRRRRAHMKETMSIEELSDGTERTNIEFNDALGFSYWHVLYES